MAASIGRRSQSYVNSERRQILECSTHKRAEIVAGVSELGAVTSKRSWWSSYVVDSEPIPILLSPNEYNRVEFPSRKALTDALS